MRDVIRDEKVCRANHVLSDLSVSPCLRSVYFDHFHNSIICHNHLFFLLRWRLVDQQTKILPFMSVKCNTWKIYWVCKKSVEYGVHTGFHVQLVLMTVQNKEASGGEDNWALREAHDSAPSAHSK